MAALRLALVASLVALTALAGCSDSGSDDGGATEEVGMHSNVFVPQSITISKGDQISWTNHDTVIHTVTADAAGGFDSGDIAGGGDYEHKFEQAGTFAYHCKKHPSMRGTITVTA